MALLKKKKKPNFNVPNVGFMVSVKARWRKPRGTANKKRMKYKFMGKLPKIGYKNAADIRGMHPTKKAEVLINTPSELEGLTNVVVRIAATVGGKKRRVIEEKAKSLKLNVVNSKFLKAEPKKFAVAVKKVSS